MSGHKRQFVALVPAPLVDLRLGQACCTGDSLARLLGPFGVEAVLTHEIVHLLRILSVPAPLLLRALTQLVLLLDRLRYLVVLFVDQLLLALLDEINLRPTSDKIEREIGRDLLNDLERVHSSTFLLTLLAILLWLEGGNLFLNFRSLLPSNARSYRYRLLLGLDERLISDIKWRYKIALLDEAFGGNLCNRVGDDALLVRHHSHVGLLGVPSVRKTLSFVA